MNFPGFLPRRADSLASPRRDFSAWNPLRIILPAIGALLVSGAAGYSSSFVIYSLLNNRKGCEGPASLACAGLTIMGMFAIASIVGLTTAYLLLRMRKIPHAAAITFFAVITTVFCAYVTTTNYIYLIPVWLAYFLWLAVYVGGFVFYDWLFNAFKAHWAKKFLLLVVPFSIIWLVDMLGNTINAGF